jgi:ABC-type transport system substrate-binding protein
MSRNRLTLAISLLMILSQVLTACATPTPPPTQAAPPTAQAAAPTTAPTAAPVVQPTEPPPAPEAKPYRVGIFSDLTTVNYWAYVGPNTTVWNAYVLVPQRLAMVAQADKTFQLVPQLAEALPKRPLQQEGDLWVSEMKIRSGINWSDGTPLTANDVAFTAQTALELQLTGGWTTNYDPVYLDHVEAVDDSTVKYYFKQDPGLAIFEYGALQGGIMSEAYWAPVVTDAKTAVEALTPPADNATDEEKAAYEEAQAEAHNVLYGFVPDGEPLVGSYTFSKWETGAFAENAANPDYWFNGTQTTEYANGAYKDVYPDGNEFTAYGDPAGDVTLDYVTGPTASSAIYTLYGTQDAAVLALRNGEIDFLLNPLGLQRGLRAQVEAEPSISVIENPTNGFRYMGFNHRRAPMSDKAFRQALATMIDKQFVTANILQGVAFPLYTMVPEGNGAWYTDDVPKFGLKEDGTSMSSEERLNAAIGILEAAGYTWEGGVKPVWDPDNREVTRGGGLIMPDGTPVPELELLAPSAGYDPLRSTFAIWIEQYANDLGIPLKANLTGFNIIVSKVFDEQDFDMWMLGWSLTIFPDYLRDFFHSDRAGLGDNNAGGYANAEFDELSDAIKACKELAECKEIADGIQQVLADELPYIVLFDTGIVEFYRNEAVDYPYTETLSGLQFQQGLPTSVLVK